jgi:glutamine amidotransferase
MDCNTPTDITFSFTGFSCRGGKTGPHADGWGLAFFEGRAARIFLEPRPCADSPLAMFLRGHPIKTLQAIAHIRQRTRGRVKLANTHPFTRELWGRSWVFAHNGTLRGVTERRLGRFRPIGETDSEHAFCVLLEELQASFPRGPAQPRALWEAVARAGGELARLGTFNFLLANGEYLLARCDTRLCYIVRRAPFGRATLADEDVSVDFRAVTTPRDRVAVIATAPLTRDEVWTLGKPATLWVFRHGRLLATLPSGTARRERPAAAAAPSR